MIYTLRSIIGDADVVCSHHRLGWVRAVPIRYYGGYVTAAWEVLRGRAIALRYPDHGELETALARSGGITVPSKREAES